MRRVGRWREKGRERAGQSGDGVVLNGAGWSGAEWVG